MALLKFEIWRDEAENEQCMFEVNAQSDRVRIATMPAGTLAYSFEAASDFEAFRANYDWNGWGQWKPESDWVERPFTDAEAEAQRHYLAERNVL